MLKLISPRDAAKLLREGKAMLVDVREADEHARERIPGATCLPLSSLDETTLEAEDDTTILFHCRSGARTTGSSSRLSAMAGTHQAFAIQGGLEAWRRAGLPMIQDRGQPIELIRQVQIAAGSLVVLGLLLGVLVAPGFLLLAGFVGAGLIVAGVTGTCGLARILRLMPWNRSGTRAPA
ncbi:rhodanese family protein [Sabulicella glaciei]|uniref:Rhodanese family protein n=1 Tax=Sabulicella glaciei TaxID=2984948 RepID=A0ABT3NPW0_9PROT|nr:rhodanese family protein [Roseococcus sp. MDT2-1-1]MCW8084195.1 rhodanese family protein [Roseococcus sp. MDT2-1-1]